jgi:hypothetical protein
MQQLIGQVFNFESGTYEKKVDGKKEERKWIKFRLGMEKPYKVEKVINGEKQMVREKTFITAKAFNGLAETLEEWFSGEENKGRWIQLFGHYEENKYDSKVEVEHPENEDAILELEIPQLRLEFIISQFAFVGPAPDIEKKPKKEGSSGKVKVKFKSKSDSNKEEEKKKLEEELVGSSAGAGSDDDVPF